MISKQIVQSITFQAPDPCKDTAVFDRSCVEAFLDQGAVVINNVFQPEYLEKVKHAYLAAYGGLRDTAREVGDDRTMIALDIKPPFSAPGLFAPEVVRPLLGQLLGVNYILDAYVAVTSRAGSPDQHVHIDFPLLFDEDEDLSKATPAYALTLAIPLIPVDAMTGVTRVWLGTHRRRIDWKNSNPDLMDSVSIIPEYGGCYLFDARLLHGGTANYSKTERPILYIIYCRPWWRDSSNFYNQKPLNISLDVLTSIPPTLRPLFRYAS